MLASSTTEIAQRVLDDRLLLKDLTERLPQLPSPSKEDYDALEHALAFWQSASQDVTVRSRLQEEKIPFTLYKLLRKQAPDDQEMP